MSSETPARHQPGQQGPVLSYNPACTQAVTTPQACEASTPPAWGLDSRRCGQLRAGLPQEKPLGAKFGASAQMCTSLDLHQICETMHTCGWFVPDPDATRQGQAFGEVETVGRGSPSLSHSSPSGHVKVALGLGPLMG